MGKFVSQSNDLWQQNLFQYRATQFPEAVGFATHTHSWLWGLATLLSSRLRNISRKEKEMLRSVKNVSSLDSVRNKDGPRLDMFYVLIYIIATFYSHASCLIRFSSSHTCLQFTSPRFLMHYPKCNTLAVRTLNCRLLQRHFRDVALTSSRITDITLLWMTLAPASIFCPGIGTRSRQRRLQRSER